MNRTAEARMNDVVQELAAWAVVFLVLAFLIYGYGDCAAGLWR